MENTIKLLRYIKESFDGELTDSATESPDDWSKESIRRRFMNAQAVAMSRLSGDLIEKIRGIERRAA